MLELLLLLWTQLICVLEELYKLFLCQLDIPAVHFSLTFVLLLNLDLVLIAFFIHPWLLFSVRLHLLLLHLLLLSFDEKLLLLIDLFIRLLLLLHGLPNLCLHRALLDPGVHDVLALPLFLLRGHLVDHLLRVFSLQQELLLGCVLLVL